MVEVERRPRHDPAATTGTERLTGVDKPLYSSAFLLVFPAIAALSGASPSHLPKNAC
jgi:hypothetical protein